MVNEMFKRGRQCDSQVILGSLFRNSSYFTPSFQVCTNLTSKVTMHCTLIRPPKCMHFASRVAYCIRLCKEQWVHCSFQPKLSLEEVKQQQLLFLFILTVADYQLVKTYFHVVSYIVSCYHFKTFTIVHDL